MFCRGRASSGESFSAPVKAPWTVASLGEEVGLSRSVFAARFTQLVGEPPLGYFRQWSGVAPGAYRKQLRAWSANAD